jgi:hypothetical protein
MSMIQLLHEDSVMLIFDDEYDKDTQFLVTSILYDIDNIT